ncbi:MAG: alanine--glyoxylate aminotransferase family protein [Rhodobacteraceae bacterium]|nr:alanine--glyoxylate aminotransferase family protein [Paracoccaceae bacterium]
MALQYGRPQLSIPGPSIMPDRVLNAMHRASPDIYEGELIDVTVSLYPDLKAVARTDGDVAIYIANGHGAWEAAICNTLSRGDKVLVINTGRFGEGWANMARALGVDTEILDFGQSAAVDPQIVAGRLGQDKAHDIKAIFTPQTDTASSVSNDIAGLRSAISDTGHPALFFVDCIASLGCERHEMDAWGVDVMVAGSQKGLMTPPGLSFVFFNEKAAAARKSAGLVSAYWDWVPRTRPEAYYQRFGGTAPTHHLFGLREALDMLVHEEGVSAAWARHERFARAIWAAVEAWAASGAFRLNVQNPAQRSHAVTTVLTGEDEGGRLRRWCKEKAGLTLGIGLGLSEPGTPEWDAVFRIGHMGHLNVPMVMGMIGTIDAGLKALGIAHGDGASETAARVISEHDFS